MKFPATPLMTILATKKGDMLINLSSSFLGDPMPQVTWWRDNHLIDSSFEKTFSKTVQNTLSVPQVTREDLGATLMCQASNNNISAPASTRATIDLKCKPNAL